MMTAEDWFCVLFPSTVVSVCNYTIPVYFSSHVSCTLYFKVIECKNSSRLGGLIVRGTSSYSLKPIKSKINFLVKSIERQKQ